MSILKAPTARVIATKRTSYNFTIKKKKKIKMKNLSSINLLLSLVGLLVSFLITIGSSKADAPMVNVCAYSLIVVAVVSFMAEAFRLLVKECARWQWTRIVLWLSGGIVGSILGLLLS